MFYVGQAIWGNSKDSREFMGHLQLITKNVWDSERVGTLNFSGFSSLSFGEAVNSGRDKEDAKQSKQTW